MITVRRRKQRARKDLARVAKQAKRLRRQQVGVPDAAKIESNAV